MVKQFAQMTIFEHRSVASAVEQLGQQMMATLISQTLQALMVKEDAAARERMIDAKSSAVSAFKWVMQDVPFPFNAALAPVAAAAAFAGIMAFEHGGEIPGSGPVPIMAHGGEHVVTKALNDQVKNSHGRGGGGHTVNVHTTIHAVDAAGFEKLLDKHATVVQRHVTGQLRKMNRK